MEYKRLVDLKVCRDSNSLEDNSSTEQYPVYEDYIKGVFTDTQLCELLDNRYGKGNYSLDKRHSLVHLLDTASQVNTDVDEAYPTNNDINKKKYNGKKNVGSTFIHPNPGSPEAIDSFNKGFANSNSSSSNTSSGESTCCESVTVELDLDESYNDPEEMNDIKRELYSSDKGWRPYDFNESEEVPGAEVCLQSDDNGNLFVWADIFFDPQDVLDQQIYEKAKKDTREKQGNFNIEYHFVGDTYVQVEISYSSVTDIKLAKQFYEDIKYTVENIFTICTTQYYEPVELDLDEEIDLEEQDKLSAQDRVEFKNLINSTNDIQVLSNYLNTKLQEDLPTDSTLVIRVGRTLKDLKDLAHQICPDVIMYNNNRSTFHTFKFAFPWNRRYNADNSDYVQMRERFYWEGNQLIQEAGLEDIIVYRNYYIISIPLELWKDIKKLRKSELYNYPEVELDLDEQINLQEDYNLDRFNRLLVSFDGVDILDTDEVEDKFFLWHDDFCEMYTPGTKPEGELVMLGAFMLGYCHNPDINRWLQQNLGYIHDPDIVRMAYDAGKFYSEDYKTVELNLDESYDFKKEVWQCYTQDRGWYTPNNRGSVVTDFQQSMTTAGVRFLTPDTNYDGSITYIVKGRVVISSDTPSYTDYSTLDNSLLPKSDIFDIEYCDYTYTGSVVIYMEPLREFNSIEPAKQAYQTLGGLIESILGNNYKTVELDLEEDFTDNPPTKGCFTCVDKEIKDMVNPPDDIVITDNGALDLEKRGLSGFYVWVGYRHCRGSANKKRQQMVKELAHGAISKALMKYCGANYSIIEDFTKSTDMYRVYCNSESIYREVELDLEEDFTDDKFTPYVSTQKVEDRFKRFGLQVVDLLGGLKLRVKKPYQKEEVVYRLMKDIDDNWKVYDEKGMFAFNLEDPEQN